MIGILPAAGLSTRFNGFPKYLLPIKDTNLISVHYARMMQAGASSVLVATSDRAMPFLYSFGPLGAKLYNGGDTMSASVLNGRDLADNEPVLFSMPDSFWINEDVHKELADNLPDYDAVIALWAIRPNQRGKLGQVKFNPEGFVTEIIDKDPNCPYEWAWGAIAWKPSFWTMIDPNTPHVGYALKKALDQGMTIKALGFEGNYYDCGSFESYCELCATCYIPANI